MMVEDPSGNKALLGRPKKLRPGVLTCLSGFIEQVSIQDPNQSSQSGSESNLLYTFCLLSLLYQLSDLLLCYCSSYESG